MAKTTTSKVTFCGKTYDLDKLEEAAQIQALLVPDNYPGSKREGVRLYLSLQNMIVTQFRRHFTHNFPKIVKTAVEEKADGDGEPIVAVAFGFDLNFTAPTVAAHGKVKMSFSRKYSTESKPATHDVNQGEFLDADLSVVLDTTSLDREMEPEAKPEKVAKPKKEKAGKKSAAAQE